MNPIFATIICVLLVLSPIDLIPDVLFPIGFLDDIGYISWAVNAWKSE